jgi:NTE family protein
LGWSSKDYEFSKKSIEERIRMGYQDGKKAVKKSPWKVPVSATAGLTLHDMAPIKRMKKTV